MTELRGGWERPRDLPHLSYSWHPLLMSILVLINITISQRLSYSPRLMPHAPYLFCRLVNWSLNSLSVTLLTQIGSVATSLVLKSRGFIAFTSLGDSCRLTDHLTGHLASHRALLTI